MIIKAHIDVAVPAKNKIKNPVLGLVLNADSIIIVRIGPNNEDIPTDANKIPKVEPANLNINNNYTFFQIFHCKQQVK